MEKPEIEEMKAELEALKKKNEELEGSVTSEKIALAEEIAGRLVLKGDLAPGDVGTKARELQGQTITTLVRLLEDATEPAIKEENSYQTNPSLARARLDVEALIRNANIDQLMATAHDQGEI